MVMLSYRLLALSSFLMIARAQDPLLERMDAEECTLQCRNDGVCTLGEANFGFASQLEDEDPIPFAEQEHTQFCACPEGYTGLQCEIKFVTCAGRSHTCFNGGECAMDETDQGENFFHCECDAAHSDLSRAYAGHFCQHVATTMCASDTSTNHSFCTNGGRCREMISTDNDEHKGCDCPSEWNGPHCEFVKSSPKNSVSTGGVVMITAVASFLAVALVAVVTRIVHNRRRSKDQTPSYPTDEPQVRAAETPDHNPDSELI